MLYDKYPEMANGWSKSFWARGYYVATVGNITEEAVRAYIEEQKEESKREGRRQKTVDSYRGEPVEVLETPAF